MTLFDTTGEVLETGRTDGVAVPLPMGFGYVLPCPFRLPVRYPWVTEDGHVWIHLTGDETGTARWIVFDTDGQPRGRLDLPADIRPLWTDGNTFWASDPDELDVPWLVRYRLRPAS